MLTPPISNSPGPADLLDLAVARAELGGVGGPLGAHDHPGGALGEAGERRLGRIDDDGHLPSAKPDAGMAVIRQFHESPVCRLGAISRSRRSAGRLCDLPFAEHA